MAEDTILIKVRDRDPLLVSKQRLVENSSVFSYIILECSQPEHDVTDFTPEIVETFLTLLEDKIVEEIEETDFRELHKISVVFNVEWLIESCRDWLLERINNVGDVIDYGSLLFLFEECFYIDSKWNLTKFMETLIMEVRFKDNSLFLSRYIRVNYDQLSTDQLKFLLHLAGSNTKVFMELIIERINNQECLDDRTRYLLQHMNLPLCVEKNEHLYHEMSERLPEMSDMSKDDLRLVLKLTTGATRKASVHKNDTSPTTTVSDYIEEWLSLYGDCESLADITRFITEGRISNMYSVIEILAKVTHKITLSTEEMEEFVESIENLCHNKTLIQRISTRYIDMVSSALECGRGHNKTQFIQLLEMIRDSEKLSSVYDRIHLVGEEVTQSTVVKSVKNVLGLKKPDKYVFRMKLPGASECRRKGDCGFIFKLREGVAWYELSKEDSDYTNSGVHLHDEIRAEHMNWYRIMTGTTREGKTVRVPARWKQWWSEWLCECFSRDWEREEQCVDYVISDYLVAKY